jgi:hypothetical protein
LIVNMFWIQNHSTIMEYQLVLNLMRLSMIESMLIAETTSLCVKIFHSFHTMLQRSFITEQFHVLKKFFATLSCEASLCNGMRFAILSSSLVYNI